MKKFIKDTLHLLWFCSFMGSILFAGYGLVFIEIAFIEKSNKLGFLIVADIVLWIIVFLFFKFTKWR